MASSGVILSPSHPTNSKHQRATMSNNSKADPTRRVQCTKCFKSLGERSIKRHMAMHLRMYRCAHCRQHFAKASHRDAHEQAHTEFLLVCGACDFGTTCNSAMTRHKWVAHKTREALGEMNVHRPWRHYGSHWVSHYAESTPSSAYDTPGASPSTISLEHLPSPLSFTSPSPDLPTHDYQAVEAHFQTQAESADASSSMLFREGWSLPPSDLLAPTYPDGCFPFPSSLQTQMSSLPDAGSTLSPLAISTALPAEIPYGNPTTSGVHRVSLPILSPGYVSDGMFNAEEWAFMYFLDVREAVKQKRLHEYNLSLLFSFSV